MTDKSSRKIKWNYRNKSWNQGRQKKILNILKNKCKDRGKFWSMLIITLDGNDINISIVSLDTNTRLNYRQLEDPKEVVDSNALWSLELDSGTEKGY